MTTRNAADRLPDFAQRHDLEVPFTQYLLPNGRRVETGIERPAHVVMQANRFIKAGGKYECEILTTGHVSLTAQIEIDGEPQDVEIQICQNGAEIPDAVDRLVSASLKHIGA